MPRDRFLKQSLGNNLYSQISQSRILVVGAGGIGCELLKNLVTTGFKEIHVVDLDTIDLSNLNRQFLFRHAHIKKSKALVAKETAGKFNPGVSIEAYHANIKDPQFNIEWFKSFVIVFNALDNLDARRHVNRMCIAAEVPLIESGTTGFNGQVQPIKPGQTQCYDCSPKETPKSFPVCTIRSTPSQPIHCIVWAKSYLFTELFGIGEDEAPELDHTEDSDNKEEIENLRQEAAALQKIRQSMGSQEFPRRVFEKVYSEDIERLRSMEDMWKTRKPPNALDYETLLPKATEIPPTIFQQDQRTWTLEENVAVFNSSLTRLSNRLDEAKAKSIGNAPPILTFDKDDKDTLDFVASAANLRSISFGIETRSEFDIKQMAGNIIPAIATTNATTAALCVLQAFKVLQGNVQKAKMVFLSKSVDRALDREDLRAPDPGCAVCGNARATLAFNPERATLGDFVNEVLKSKLGYSDELSIQTDAGLIYDPDLEENLSKKLSDLGVVKDSFVTIIDDDDDSPRINLILAVSEIDFPETSPPVVLVPEALQIPKKAKPTNGVTHSETNGHVEPAGQKRKRDADEAELETDNIRKRGKVAEQPNGTAITIDDDEGAIVLD
ncbi:ubiquitin-activating enzyme E1 3 [Myriangium duriaei CBS 260.36]|uniref:Ubiquitin-activating enzyme E1-like n=1 Tax=Myriangium duriaei CBS 260.36 TaxID=1168546 RepID=A0A9P4J108_9PEZI|nr:ubiquitin-activating enzyme E1 3 [Myriangium duriaei CBS 260.36]